MKQLVVPVIAVLFAAESLSAASAEQPEARQEKKICRVEKATGSLTRRTRICMTEAQWRELNARTGRGVDEMNGAPEGARFVIPTPRIRSRVARAERAAKGQKNPGISG